MDHSEPSGSSVHVLGVPGGAVACFIQTPDIQPFRKTDYTRAGISEALKMSVTDQPDKDSFRAIQALEEQEKSIQHKEKDFRTITPETQSK